MKRILEPEVMDVRERTQAYARADFSAVNQLFVDRFLKKFPDCSAARIADLGCGPADIPIRLALSAPRARITAVDASGEMLKLARKAVAAAGVADRLVLLKARVPNLPVKPGSFGAVVSNSLAHHLPDPAALWSEIRRLGRPGTAVYVMDLFRPVSKKRARELVEAGAKDEHPLLKDDFYNSLLAAFTLEEVRKQLNSAGLTGLKARIISERHWLATGRL